VCADPVPAEDNWLVSLTIKFVFGFGFGVAVGGKSCGCANVGCGCAGGCVVEVVVGVKPELELGLKVGECAISVVFDWREVIRIKSIGS
jgi:hypothetical protein